MAIHLILLLINSKTILFWTAMIRFIQNLSPFGIADFAESAAL